MEVKKPCEHIKALMDYLNKESLGVEMEGNFGGVAGLYFSCGRCEQSISSFYVENPEA